MRKAAPELPKVLKIEHLKTFDPLTDNQKLTRDLWSEGNNLVLSGSAGTGKTFTAMYLALQDVLDKSTFTEKLHIIRSVVPTRDMGFMPGSYEEKLNLYNAPYKSICAELFHCSDAYSRLVEAGSVVFESTSYLRGLTFSDSIVIVDECQNLTFHELDTVIGRLGQNCRIIFCGDYYQSDLRKDTERSEHLKFFEILDQVNRFEIIEFTWVDIIRSGLVRDYIMTKERMERDQHKVPKRN